MKVTKPLSQEEFAGALSQVLESNGIDFQKFLDRGLSEDLWIELASLLNRSPRYCREFLKRNRGDLLLSVDEALQPEPPQEDDTLDRVKSRRKQLARKVDLMMAEEFAKLSLEDQKKIAFLLLKGEMSSFLLAQFYLLAIPEDRAMLKKAFGPDTRWNIHLP